MSAARHTVIALLEEPPRRRRQRGFVRRRMLSGPLTRRGQLGHDWPSQQQLRDLIDESKRRSSASSKPARTARGSRAARRTGKICSPSRRFLDPLQRRLGSARRLWPSG